MYYINKCAIYLLFSLWSVWFSLLGVSMCAELMFVFHSFLRQCSLYFYLLDKSHACMSLFLFTHLVNKSVLAKGVTHAVGINIPVLCMYYKHITDEHA